MKKWLLSEIQRIKATVSGWVVFWIGVITSFFVFVLLNSGSEIYRLLIDLYFLNPNVFLSLAIVTLLVFGGLFMFVVNSSVQLRRQELHKQPSWVFYSYWGLINSFLVLTIVLFLSEIKVWWVPLFVPLAVILGKLINEFFGEKVDLTFTRFASGSVGVDDDKLDFKTSAKNTAVGLLHLNSYVNVVGLYGGLGFGKSSYARMVIENLDNKKSLYTYLSLTETNEAKDFSKLFAGRWLDTLSERYPKIDVTSYLPFMDSILRESGNGIVSDLLKVISAFNRGLVKTKAYFFDEFYAKKNPAFTSSGVAKLFGNITNIEESLWIIQVDEIERAQFDEIYRLVEIVERFKNEGRSGLPTKLLFLFCISEPELGEYLETYVASDPRARLLKTFFYEDPKSITHKIFLPPIEPALKQKFVLDLLNRVIDREGLRVPEEVNPHAIGDPTRSFMNHKDAAEYTIALLREESPRIISRVATALDFFYGAFKNRAGELQKNAIRFNDIVTLEYIKIKYPYLMDFFVKTVNVLVNQAEMNNIEAYFLKKELEEKKIGLIGWIELVTGKKIPDLEKEEVNKMVGLVMYYYFDFLSRDYDTKSKDKYFGTTSYPEIMSDYLSLRAEGIETNYRKNNRIYNKHKSNPDKALITSLDNKDLISYARFLYDIPNSPIGLNVDLIKEITDRIVSEKIKPDPANVGNTPLDEAIYQLTFQIVVLTEKERESEVPSDNLEESFNAVKSVLSSPKVNTGVKFIMLSSLVNNERGGGSSIHFRLENAFKKILRHYDSEMRSLVKAVFKEAEERYLTGSKVIYKYEENFFYTLYQGWSGLKDNEEEINRIRAAAKRGLVNHPEAIKLYWRKYPVGEGWKTLKDVFDGDHFFSMSDTNNPLYMPLETLIAITKQAKIKDPEIQAKLKLWESLKDEPRLKEVSVIKDDISTLRSFLIRNGFLDAEISVKELPSGK
jgi:hypothetical protein